MTEPDATLPDTPALPISNLNTIPTASMDSRIWGETLPKAGDLAQADGSYHYLIQGNLSKNGSADIYLASGAKVVFYVQGNIDIGGNPRINQNGLPRNMQIYGNTFQRNPGAKVSHVRAMGRLARDCPTIPE